MNLDGLSNEAKMVLTIVVGVLLGGLLVLAVLGLRSGGARRRPPRPRREPPADLTPQGFVQDQEPEG